jgi:hypothetical protein
VRDPRPPTKRPEATAGGARAGDSQFLLLRALLGKNATIAGDVLQIDDDTWAIHGVIPVDGEVLMAEYATYHQARIVLDQLPDDDPQPSPVTWSSVPNHHQGGT